MQRYFMENACFNGQTIDVNPKDAHHMIHVMRFKLGDLVEVFDEAGHGYLAKIIDVSKKSVTLSIEKTLDVEDKRLSITLAQALIKKDKFELVLQKATELGVYGIIPIHTQRSMIKINDVTKKMERYMTIIKEAAEQSERTFLPKISKPMNLKTLLDSSAYDHIFVAYARHEQSSFEAAIRTIKKDAHVLMIIGPEGGFLKEELSLLKERATFVSLGQTILRSETAAIYCLSAFRLLWSN